MSFLADLLAALGTNFSVGGVQGCRLLFMDEPKMPNCLIER